MKVPRSPQTQESSAARNPLKLKEPIDPADIQKKSKSPASWFRSLTVTFMVSIALCFSVAITVQDSGILTSQKHLPTTLRSQTNTTNENNHRRTNDNEQHVYDVLVLGAGWSGLAAADALRRAGIDNMEILEARDSVGGRSRTVYPFAPDLAVELGSAWTYWGTEVHDMLEYYNIPYGYHHYEDQSTFGLYQSGQFATYNAPIKGEVTGYERDYFLNRLWWREFVPFSRRQARDLRWYGTDKPYQEVIDEFLYEWGLDYDEHDKERQFLLSMVRPQIELEYATSSERVSASHVGESVNDCVFCGSPYLVPVEGGGFDKVLAPLANALWNENKIRLNHVVTKIDYSNDGSVIVTYKTTQNLGQVIVEKTKLAKTVLVTVPLGVLKAKSIEFTPGLPQPKQNAIDFIGFGVLNKCILYWETDQSWWWPTGKEFLSLVTDQDETSGRWTSFFNDKDIGNGQHFVLSAWIGGNDAIAIEDQEDAEILNAVLGNLRDMFGNDVPDPTNYEITRWGKDVFAHGSYSYETVADEGVVDSAREALGASIEQRLFFAGEATHVDWYGTTVGAYRSGVAVAPDIIDSLYPS